MRGMVVILVTLMVCSCGSQKLQVREEHQGNTLEVEKLEAQGYRLRSGYVEGMREDFSGSYISLSADEARALVQWDRVSRPGLYHEGKTAAPAVYMYARLINH